MHRALHRLLVEYKDSKRGPTVVLLRSPLEAHVLAKGVPSLEEFPMVHTPTQER